MTLIKCPECGKRVSSKALACPGCGFDVKHRHWYTKNWGIALIVFVSLFTIFSIYKSFYNTRGLVNKINEEIKSEYIMHKDMSKIMKNYNDLSFFEKIFVGNFRKLKKTPIVATENELKNYLNFSVDFDNYKSDTIKTILGIDSYIETADVKIIIGPSGKYRFEYMTFELDINNGYVIDSEKRINVKLNDDGTFEYEGKAVKDNILNNSITSKLESPRFDLKKAKIKNVIGYVYYK